MPVTYFVRMHAVDGHEQEVEAILLENVDRIREGEPGNLAFAVHRSRDDPGEFWLYETWIDEAAVERHESGAAFASYKERIRPLTHSVLFGSCEPIDAVGFPLHRTDDG
jgi:quinol monooxygenase YgiN